MASTPQDESSDGLSFSTERVMGANEDEHHDDNPSEAQDVVDQNDYELDDDGDDITVIMLDHSTDDQGQQFAMDWIDQTGPEMEERRRNVLLRELRRVQRASFLHFVLLCLIPTVLLAIVIATVFSDENECYSEATFCELEPRTFVNAFTTRCVCDPIPVNRLAGP